MGDRAHAAVRWLASASGAIPPRRRLLAWLLVGLGLPGFTVALLPFRGTAALEVVLLLYLLTVVVVGVVGGLGPGVVGAFASFLLANFLLTEPYYTLRVEALERLLELTVFVVVAIVVSFTVEIGARHRAAAELSRDEAAAQAARARELAETDRVRSAILTAVSHDLRTPLAGIKAAVSSLRQPDVDWSSSDEAELLAMIDESSDRLTDVVTNLLAMSRIRAGAVSLRMQPVVVDEVVGNALLTLGELADRVAIDVPEDLPTVHADPDLLERMVANLVSNSLRVDRRTTQVRAWADGRRVSVAVSDHGPGVPPDQWKEMFLPFHRIAGTDAQPGSGLGLAIVKGFSDAMGTPVKPSTTPGGGLTMTVELEAM